MNDKLNFDKYIKMIKNIAKNMNRDQLASFLLTQAKQRGLSNIRKQIAEEVLRLTKPTDVIPDVYSDYRPVVHDGIRFLLSRLSETRLMGIIADQFKMEEDVETEERLIELARQVPTLHKLGQTIARNRNVDKALRKWLTQLENSSSATDIGVLRKQISEELGRNMETWSVEIGHEVLAEASVGVVVPFTWKNPDSKRVEKGVFKTIKPGIREALNEEFILLDELAAWFDKNRNRYVLKNFGFTDNFNEIKDALEKELELRNEQENMVKAAEFYAREKQVRIPRVLPFSTPNVTAMDLMEGCKVTDAPNSSTAGRLYARALFSAILCKPVFSTDEHTLFHGDPHAGNIYALEDRKRKDGQVALLDWSLSEALPKQLRINLLKLLMGVFLKDEDHIIKAIGELSTCDPEIDVTCMNKIRYIALDVMRSPEYEDIQLVEKGFLFIDQMLVNGVQFPKALLLFRKSDFTLEGILGELDPAFDMTTLLLLTIIYHCMEELPKRMAYLILPFFDSPHRYKSLLSNKDIQVVVTRFCLNCLDKGWERGTRMVYSLIEWEMRCVKSALRLPFTMLKPVTGLLGNN